MTFTRNSLGQITSLNDHSLGYYYSNTFVNYSIGSDGEYISVQITLTHGSSSSQYVDEYIYSGGWITQINRHLSDNNRWKINYSYDDKGNVIRITKYNGSDSLMSSIEFVYDNKSNPVESVDDPYLLETIYLSGYNNPLAAKYNESDGTITYVSHTYTYNDIGKPITDITSLSYDSSFYYQDQLTQYIYH